ncbi:MAG: hypothetical protein GY805_30380 [Chloroflexi bacterium]|nr:hypothetical protein [Chloroflexota bacterium]
MKLSNEDADLFFDLMLPLQFYVNQQKQIIPDVDSAEEYKDLEIELQAEVRDALWDEPTLIAQYVAENPDQLPSEQLTIIASWQSYVKGNFIFERLLKKHAIFIHNEQVYAVLALHSQFDEMISKKMLPIFLQTVLLPFRDKIIYDGLIRGGNLMIGRNMAQGFKDTYMEAKRKGELIVSFNPEVQTKAKAKLQVKLKNWQPMLDNLSDEAKKLRAQSGSPPTWSPAFSLVKASLDLAQTAVSNPTDTDALWKSFERIERTINKLEDSIYRTRD